MSSFLNKLKSGTIPTSPSGLSGKKDAHANLTPLEKLLINAGPIRKDGSDKFFGMENSITAASSTATPRASALKTATGGVRTPNASARNPGAPMGGGQKTEDRDTPDYKKKQALANGPILNMSYQNTGAYDMPETLFTSLKDVFEAIVANGSRRGVVSPTKFLEVLRRDNEMFRTSMHQDAHEFLNWLLNQTVESVDANTKKRQIEREKQGTEGKTEMNGTIHWPDSGPFGDPAPPQPKVEPMPRRWVHDLFEGTLTSETRCLTCENISQRDEAFLDLSVDLDQHSSVTACLRRFSEEEMLCERNKFHCDNCGGLQEAEKRMKIKRLPKILALHLKRFKYTEDLQRLQKLFHRVVYPYHLRLFNTTDDADDPDKIYELYAVVVHIGGGPYHGHYVAIIKTQDRGWLLFDDELVEPVDPSYVRNFFGDRPGLACAYVLFYQETTDEAVAREQKREGKPPRTEEQTNAKANGSATADLSRIISINPPSDMDESAKFSRLNPSVTAPSLPAVKSTSSIVNLTSPLSPRRADLFWRKDRSKDDKTRPEKEKSVKKAASTELLNHLPPLSNLANSPPIIPVSPDLSSTVVEPPAVVKEKDKENFSTSSGLDRFKRTSKSLKFGSLGRREKSDKADKEKADKEKEKEKAERDNKEGKAALDKTAHTAAVAVGSAVDDDADSGEKEKDKEKDKGGEKKGRFSIRKKSFGLLS